MQPNKSQFSWILMVDFESICHTENNSGDNLSLAGNTFEHYNQMDGT